jgi:putative ABC transport system ATP-binding protein
MPTTPASPVLDPISAASAAAASPLITVRELVKQYDMGDFIVHALRGVSLDIGQGEFVAVMGPSGSGKSTFMHLIGCLDRPTSGDYYIDGLHVADLGRDELAEVRNQKIGFVFQGFNLLPRTAAVENVELPLAYAGVKTAERRRRALEALDAVGLGQRAGHFPNQLSGGQQQRVAIARALVTGAPLLLADEPTGNLDSKTSEEVMALLVRMNEERGITIVLVTHEPDISEFAKRVVVFKDGKIEADRLNQNRRRPAGMDAAPGSTDPGAKSAEEARTDTRNPKRDRKDGGKDGGESA